MQVSYRHEVFTQRAIFRMVLTFGHLISCSKFPGLMDSDKCRMASDWLLSDAKYSLVFKFTLTQINEICTVLFMGPCTKPICAKLMIYTSLL